MKFNKSLFKELLSQAKLNYPKVAEELTARGQDTTVDGIKAWMKTASKVIPSFERLTILGDILKVDPILLISESPAMPSDPNIILIDKLDMLAGAGSSGYMDVPQENNKIAVDRKMFINGLKPENTKMIEIIGDSMQPKFNEGDYAIIDMVNGRDNFTRVEGVYIVRVGDVVYIKDVTFLPDGKLILKSINEDYADILPHKEGYDYEILGKVCGRIQIQKGLAFNKQDIK